MIDAAETAYQVEALMGKSARFSSTDTVCFDLTYLCKKGYFEKGCEGLDENGEHTGDGYTGSVLAYYNKKTSKIEYSFWISNGTYVFGQDNGAGATASNYYDIEDENIVRDGSSASNTCGGKTSSANIVYCSGTGCE